MTIPTYFSLLMIQLNLSSRIVLNNVTEQYYHPSSEIERSELTRCEKVPTYIYAKTEEGVMHIADRIERLITERQREHRPCVLGLGTGHTLMPVYEELVRRHLEQGLSFDNVVVFNAYEFFPLSDRSAHSSIGQLRQHLLDHVDIRADRVHTLCGTVPQAQVRQHCHEYEQAIEQAGGIDLMLIGIGRMGNIAANEPGATLTSATRLILTDRLLREEMTMSFGSTEAVPPCTLTIGMGTVLKARAICLAAWGEAKSDVIRRAVEGSLTDTLPASFLQTHNDVQVVVDLDAASQLTRLVRPWLVTSCHWTDRLIRAAVVWLCGVTQKPILKLTNKDYNENGLSELLALYGSAYNVNIKIFNDLQHTITGWPGGKPHADDTYRPERATPYPKRVIVFSPHPDDDVISMGGTLRRLVEQGHDVHVAYETSGNIAVNDDDVRRYLGFGLAMARQMDGGDHASASTTRYRDLLAQIEGKSEGEHDSREILSLKGLIRRGEAQSACRYNGIGADHIHFLDLPFYESGRIEKYPLAERDVNIIRDLLVRVKPHQIYVAGDLADPHGTHRKCTDAVLAAVDMERQEGARWLGECRIWMYRGAWAEWDIDNIEMCVPMSPEELRAKRNAILKHQSQMESAPFLGNDERLFWQRAEDRNRGTAQVYDRLGLACYEAMEAFVEYRLE